MACKYCGGRGCLYCPEPPKPDGMPGLLATFRRDEPADMELARQTIGGPALEKAFGPGGGGIEEIINNCRGAGLIQAIRRTTETKGNHG